VLKIMETRYPGLTGKRLICNALSDKLKKGNIGNDCTGLIVRADSFEEAFLPHQATVQRTTSAAMVSPIIVDMTGRPQEPQFGHTNALYRFYATSTIFNFIILFQQAVKVCQLQYARQKKLVGRRFTRSCVCSVNGKWW